ncbi:MAG: selenium cofactor biosynthesis protein YqeC [Lachnospiraceae bacterium]
MELSIIIENKYDWIKNKESLMKYHVIAFCGSGGKTTLLYQMAEALAKDGKKVIITTTTHMFLEENLCETIEQVRERLVQENLCVAARRDQNPKKMHGFSLEEFADLTGLADYILVEADGSRQLPYKIPANWEPVIPKQTELIVHVIGMNALGRRLGECCHRWELAKKWEAEITADSILTTERVKNYYQKGYGVRYAAEYPEIPIWIVLNYVLFFDKKSK